MQLDEWETRPADRLPVTQFLMPNGTWVACGGEHAQLFFDVVREAHLAA